MNQKKFRSPLRKLLVRRSGSKRRRMERAACTKLPRAFAGNHPPRRVILSTIRIQAVPKPPESCTPFASYDCLLRHYPLLLVDPCGQTVPFVKNACLQGQGKAAKAMPHP